jgi:hypothetical protein
MTDVDEVNEDYEYPRPETSYGNKNHGGHDIHLPSIVINEFQRLATALNLDYTDTEELLGLSGVGEQDISSSNLSYFMNEIIRKVDRLQHQQTFQTEYDDDYDEKESKKKKKKAEINKKEQVLLKKASKLDEDIHFYITTMKEQNPQDQSRAEGKFSQQKLMKNYFKEKEQKKLLQEFVESQNKKIKVLVGHVEKLMKALKTATNKKLKLSEEYHLLQKEGEVLKQKIDKQNLIQAVQTR